GTEYTVGVSAFGDCGEGILAVAAINTTGTDVSLTKKKDSEKKTEAPSTPTVPAPAPAPVEKKADDKKQKKQPTARAPVKKGSKRVSAGTPPSNTVTKKPVTPTTVKPGAQPVQKKAVAP